MKRFFEHVTVDTCADGYQILLDGRVVKTPRKTPLQLPFEALAEAVAGEWRAQGEVIDPHSMPVTRLANTAADRVVSRFDAVAAEVAGFGASDLICYRASHPAPLVQRQAEVWGPYLAWSENALGASLIVTDGIMPVSQSESTLTAFRRAVDACTPYELTGLHQLTTAFGSLTLGLAHMHGFVPFDAAWAASQLDELFQEEQWGTDDEALARRQALHSDAKAASEYLGHLI